MPAFNGVMLDQSLTLFLLNVFSIRLFGIIGETFDNIICWAGRTIGLISMFALFMSIDLCLCVKFTTVCLLSRYMHILPFEILERNLIVLDPIIFPIARAYSLIVIRRLQDYGLVLGRKVFLFVAFAYELAGSVRFP